MTQRRVSTGILFGIAGVVLSACQFTSVTVTPPDSTTPVETTPKTQPKPSIPTATFIQDGTSRQVDLKSFRHTGRGTLVRSSGLRQQGNWLNGKLHGYGEESSDNHAYQGSWQHGQRHGEGSELTPDGFSYRGAWHNNQKQGYGTLKYPNQVTYEGMWHANQKHGFGLEERPDSSYYKGNWHQGQHHGDGSLRRPDGTILTGTWHYGELSGLATLTTIHGVSIQGNVSDEKIMQGTLSLQDGSTFAGQIYAADHRYAAEFFSWLLATAHANSAMAQFLVAKAHLNADVSLPDLREALIWLERATSQNLALAQYELAILIIEQDGRRGTALLHEAARQGHAAAHAVLGEHYHKGLHVPQDLTLAVSHYQKAIDGGNLEALNNYAWLLATTPTNYSDASLATELIQPLVLYLNNWQLLDTFAAAQARVGNYELAVSLQTQVLKDAQTAGVPGDTIFSLESRLELYRLGQPYTEP